MHGSEDGCVLNEDEQTWGCVVMADTHTKGFSLVHVRSLSHTHTQDVNHCVLHQGRQQQQRHYAPCRRNV